MRSGESERVRPTIRGRASEIESESGIKIRKASAQRLGYICSLRRAHMYTRTHTHAAASAVRVMGKYVRKSGVREPVRSFARASGETAKRRRGNSDIYFREDRGVREREREYEKRTCVRGPEGEKKPRERGSK